MKPTKRFIIAVLISFIASSALARDIIPGPIPATIIEVTDGDTVTVQAQIWLGNFITTKVRLDGIDTPELKGKCQMEKDLAQKAKQFVSGTGKSVTLTNIYFGKYAGRVIASVRTKDGNDLAGLLIDNGLGREYQGGKRQGWCG